MDICFLGTDDTLEDAASSTQTTQATVTRVQTPDRHISGNESITWWIAIFLLLGVAVAAVVGGLIIKHKTDDLIR